MDLCFEDPFFCCSNKAGAQNMESQVEGVGSHVIGLPWVWATTFASWIWKGEVCWAARRSTLSAAMIKCSFTTIPYLARYDHLIRLKDQRRPRQSNEIIH